MLYGTWLDFIRAWTFIYLECYECVCMTYTQIHTLYVKPKLTFQLDHLQAKWMHTAATTVGLYCKHIVVICKL